jgi:DNA polymerase-3 subunit alpha
MGIAVQPPEINTSGMDFTVEPEGIRFGLSAVKNVGEAAVQTILEARGRLGRFGSLSQLCAEVDLRLVNKRVLESLARAGALDRLGSNRATVFAAIDSAMERAQRSHRDRASGQAGLFGGPRGGLEEAAPLTPVPEWADRERLSGEKETLGFYVTGHPLLEHADRVGGLATHTTASLREVSQPRPATVAGIVSAVRKRRTKKGDVMAVFTLEDLEGTVEVVIFPEAYARHRSLVEDDRAVLLTGSVEIAEEQRRLIAETLLPLEQAEEKKAREVVIALTAPGLEPATVERVRDLLKERPGPCPVVIEITQPMHFRAVVRAGTGVKVTPSRDLALAIEGVLGKGAVRFR